MSYAKEAGPAGVFLVGGSPPLRAGEGAWVGLAVCGEPQGRRGWIMPRNAICLWNQ